MYLWVINGNKFASLILVHIKFKFVASSSRYWEKIKLHKHALDVCLLDIHVILSQWNRKTIQRNLHHQYSLSAFNLSSALPHILPKRLNLLLLLYLPVFLSILSIGDTRKFFQWAFNLHRMRKTSQVVHSYFQYKRSTQNNLKIFIRLVFPNYLAWVHINWGIREF